MSTINWNTATEPAHPQAIIVDNNFSNFDYETNQLAPTNPLDLEPIRKKLLPYETMLEEMHKEAESINVDDANAAERATELGVKLRKIAKTVEEARVFFKRPALDFSKSIDGLSKRYIDKATAAGNILARKVGQFQALKRKEELAILQKQQEEAAKLQKQIDKEAKAAGVDAPVVNIPKSIPAPATIRTESGKAIATERWVCRIEDEKLVPREYCEPKQSLLNEAVRSGVRNIPGCVIELEANAKFGE